jgi:hypothetical protein
MKALRILREKAGNLLKRTSNFLNDNIKSIYAVLVTAILFIGLGLKHQADYAIKLLEIQKDVISIEGNLNLARQINKEQADFIDFQTEINHSLRKLNADQQNTLQRAGEAIYELTNELTYQKAFIQKLVEYLKSIKEWPPKNMVPPERPKPTDPDKWI